MKLRCSLPSVFITLLAITACAGTAPNAVQRNFPAARLDVENRVNCELTRNRDRCARNRDLNAVKPLADDGFLNAQAQQARETKRDNKRRERED